MPGASSFAEEARTTETEERGAVEDAGRVGPEAAARPFPDQVVAESAAVGDQMARLVRLVGVWKQRVRDEGYGDRVLLGRLAEAGPRRATDLAADTLLDLSTVSRQIRSLVERGLVERRPDPEDGRGSLLSPTVAGLAAVERYRAQRDQQLAEALARWPAGDRRDFARLLERFNDDFAEHHVRPACAHPHGHGHSHGPGGPLAGRPTDHSGSEDGHHGHTPEPAGHPLPHHRRARSTGQIQENP
ncbi:MarR family winged helix-turn-helix transcriptional regulator [Actinacidiphila yeochonensis]|uniref:MarR family winged helix-turn-helix transcriptional regulator n=1 Tax=Actinacidiphila yeochonensis TaxID=89050 RepID=UPI001E645447|nr:MarR family winged helix-turn-helix transcriptional regulator [Actinacidiphila yeochonensis]